MDWVKGVLVHEKNALLAERGDIEGMAKQVTRLLSNRELAVSIADTFYKYALESWGESKVIAALGQIFPM